MLVQCVPIELLSTTLTLCGVDPVCVSIELFANYFSSTQCGVDVLCASIELFANYFSSTRCNVDLFCASIELLLCVLETLDSLN